MCNAHRIFSGDHFKVDEIGGGCACARKGEKGIA